MPGNTVEEQSRHVRWRVESLGESAWLLTPDLPRATERDVLHHVLNARRALQGLGPGLTMQAGAHSLLLEAAPGMGTDGASIQTCLAHLGGSPEADMETAAPGLQDRHSRAPVEQIAVCFDGEDLAFTAEQLALSREEFCERLCQLELNVCMLGFLPGFAYLGWLPPELTLPRRNQPRTRVAAGSLALGGRYLGIYPCAAPGGWHLLGNVREVMFDPARMPPTRLQAGMRVRLRRVEPR